MEEKGTKLTKSVAVLEKMLMKKLDTMEGITSKKMFGGYGIFHEKKMFGIISAKSEIFFKVNETTQAEYEAKGAVRHSRMPYFTVPDKILSNKKNAISWAKKSIEISK